MTVEKPKPKQLLRPITTGAGSVMNQSQFLAIICNLLKAREKSRLHGAIGFGFASHWLKNWRESFKPIITRSNSNQVITFDSYLKTTLLRFLNLQGYPLVIWITQVIKYFSVDATSFKIYISVVAAVGVSDNYTDAFQNSSFHTSQPSKTLFSPSHPQTISFQVPLDRVSWPKLVRL